MNKKVLTGAERKAQLLEAGAKLAAKYGAVNVTRRMVAQACKCAEGLVTLYMGTSGDAQKAYARKAKALGLTLPDKARAEAIGQKLRAHGPRDKRDSRKRSPREVEAIKRKASARETKPKAAPSRKPVKPNVKPQPSPAVTRTPPERKTAARAPKEPPKAALPMPPTDPQHSFP